MYNTCCGKEQSTPYCGHCGKQLIQSKLYSLLQYLREREVYYQKRIKFTARTHIDSESDVKLRDKWKGWADELEMIVYPKSHIPTPDELDHLHKEGIDLLSQEQ